VKTDNEMRLMATGNTDRLSDDELDIVCWALSLDLKGDCGLRSNAGVYEVAGNFEPTRPRKNSAGVVTSMYVKKPKGSSKKNEMGDRMLQAAALDRAARQMLSDIGAAHRQTLWACYVTSYPDGLRASLEAFGDLGPLVPGTKAAKTSLAAAWSAKDDEVECANKKCKRTAWHLVGPFCDTCRRPNALSYCQGLSARIITSQAQKSALDPLDIHAMQAICDETEPILSDACRSAKASLRRYRANRRLDAIARDAARHRTDSEQRPAPQSTRKP
jgi:hypothetical protein